MKEQKPGKLFLPILLVFIGFSLLFIANNAVLKKLDIKNEVMIVGNILLFAVTMISFFLGLRGLRSSNNFAFVRAVYGGILIKLFVCIIATFIYAFAFRSLITRGTLFSFFFLYIVYTFLEVRLLQRKARETRHA